MSEMKSFCKFINHNDYQDFLYRVIVAYRNSYVMALRPQAIRVMAHDVLLNYMMCYTKISDLAINKSPAIINEIVADIAKFHYLPLETVIYTIDNSRKTYQDRFKLKFSLTSIKLMEDKMASQIIKLYKQMK